jgi:hypothetical protein
VYSLCFPHYQCDLLKKLIHLEQGKNSLEVIRNRKGMTFCGVEEDIEDLLAHFFGGLNKEIQNIIDYKEYNIITYSFHIACKDDREVHDHQAIEGIIFLQVAHHGGHHDNLHNPPVVPHHWPLPPSSLVLQIEHCLLQLHLYPMVP